MKSASHAKTLPAPRTNRRPDISHVAVPIIVSWPSSLYPLAVPSTDNLSLPWTFHKQKPSQQLRHRDAVRADFTVTISHVHAKRPVGNVGCLRTAIRYGTTSRTIIKVGLCSALKPFAQASESLCAISSFSQHLRMLRSLAILALLGADVHASYSGNLNFRSPSTEHPSLGIDLAKVVKRHAKRDNTEWDDASLNFTHGIASVRTDCPLHVSADVLGRPVRRFGHPVDENRPICGQ